MTRTVLCSILGSLVGALASAGPALAADPKPSGSDPEAVKLLGEVGKAYQALSAYSDQGEFVHSLTLNGKAQRQVLPIRLTLVRPDKLAIDTGAVKVVSDGKTLTTAVGPFKKYAAVPAPKAVTFETFRDGPLGSILFGGPSAATSALFFSLLADPDGPKTIEGGGGALKLEADRRVGETTFRSLLIDLPKGVDYRLLVDPATKLLTAIDWVVDPHALAAATPAGETIAVDRIGWSAGKVSTEAPKDEAFAYQPPAGFSKVASFERPRGEEKSPILELVGKPAPDFTLTVLDGPGKTRTVAKADLAGKVVLIDFWATWCPPCLEELPEIGKLVDDLAKEGKDAVVVALSVDRKPSDLAGVRKLVEATLDERKVSLAGSKVGLVGLDPSGAIGEAYRIEAIPALVLIDGKGVVQAAHVGVQTREGLAKEINTLLEGKSLLAPKADEGTAGAK